MLDFRFESNVNQIHGRITPRVGMLLRPWTKIKCIHIPHEFVTLETIFEPGKHDKHNVVMEGIPEFDNGLRI